MNKPDTNHSDSNRARALRERVLEEACALGAELNAIQPQVPATSFWAMVDELPIGRQMAINLMALSKRRQLVDRANWPLLPTDFKAVVALAHVPSAKVEHAFAAGRIHPAMTTQDVLDL